MFTAPSNPVGMLCRYVDQTNNKVRYQIFVEENSVSARQDEYVHHAAKVLYNSLKWSMGM